MAALPSAPKIAWVRKATRQPVGDGGRQRILGERLIDDRQDLGSAPLRRGQFDPLVGDPKVDSLNDARHLRRLRLGCLRAKAEEVEQHGESFEGRRRLGEFEGVEVVDVVAAEDEEERPEQGLKGVAGAVEVPDRGCGAEAHGQVKPKGHAVVGGQERARVGRMFHGPLAVRRPQVVAEDAGVTAGLHQAPRHVDEVIDEVVRRDVPGPDCAVVASPRRRSFSSPFSSNCRMGKDAATKTSCAGGSTRWFMQTTSGRATVRIFQSSAEPSAVWPWRRRRGRGSP